MRNKVFMKNLRKKVFRKIVKHNADKYPAEQ